MTKIIIKLIQNKKNVKNHKKNHLNQKKNKKIIFYKTININFSTLKKHFSFFLILKNIMS